MKRIEKAIPLGTLRGNLHTLAIVIRAMAIGGGRVVVAVHGDTVHAASDRRPFAHWIERCVAGSILAVYDQRAKAREILDDLNFAAERLARNEHDAAEAPQLRAA